MTTSTARVRAASAMGPSNVKQGATMRATERAALRDGEDRKRCGTMQLLLLLLHAVVERKGRAAVDQWVRVCAALRDEAAEAQRLEARRILLQQRRESRLEPVLSSCSRPDGARWRSVAAGLAFERWARVAKARRAAAAAAAAAAGARAAASVAVQSLSLIHI